MIMYKGKGGTMRYGVAWCFVLLLIPLSVSGHVYLLECNPEQDAILDAPPEKITITFVGTLEPVFSKIEVFDSEGKKVSGKKTAFSEDDTVMEVALDADLDSGKYTVKWKCMSLDGHKQTGEYTFTIK
jgi:methionine-rich copper-binding protein CopC